MTAKSNEILLQGLPPHPTRSRANLEVQLMQPSNPRGRECLCPAGQRGRPGGLGVSSQTPGANGD